MRVTKNLFAMKQKIAVLIKDISTVPEGTPYDITSEFSTRYADCEVKSVSSSVLKEGGRMLLIITFVSEP